MALAVVAVVVVSALRLQSQNVAMTEAIAFHRTAPLLAQSKLGELTAEGFEASATAGDFGDDHPGYAWALQMEEAVGTEPDLAEVGRRLKRITLLIDYNGGSHVYRIHTQRLAPP